MEKINIDRKIAERADEFALREYECGADERAHLSKGYYWGYKDAQKDLALTWEDIASLVRIMFDYHMETGSFYLTDEDLCKEVLKRFNEQREKK